MSTHARWTSVAPKLFLRQVSVMTFANLKTRYRKTFAGFIWVILNPLILFGVQSLIFNKILKLQVANYYLFLLSGLLPWLFTNQTLEMCTPLLSNQGQLLKAFPIHPLVYLAAQIADNFFNFLMAFLILLIPISMHDDVTLVGILLLPIPLFLLLITVLSLSWFLSTLQVFYRDVRYVITFVLSVSFFLTPVFYPIEFLPIKYRWLAYINIFYIVIAPFRAALHEFDVTNFTVAITRSFFVAFGLFMFALHYWRKKKTDIYFNV